MSVYVGIGGAPHAEHGLLPAERTAPRADHQRRGLVLGQVAEEIEHQYSREQAVVFWAESGIDLERIPAPADFQPLPGQGMARIEPQKGRRL